MKESKGSHRGENADLENVRVVMKGSQYSNVVKINLRDYIDGGSPPRLELHPEDTIVVPARRGGFLGGVFDILPDDLHLIEIEEGLGLREVPKTVSGFIRLHGIQVPQEIEDQSGVEVLVNRDEHILVPDFKGVIMPHRMNPFGFSPGS